MANTANDNFRDALIRHQIGLQRLSGSLSKKVATLLGKTQNELKGLITTRLNAAAAGQTLSPNTLKRLQGLENAVRELRHAALDDSYKVMAEQSRALVLYEPEFISQATKHVSPVLLDFSLPPAAQLTALVASQPFEGKTLKQWAANQKATDVRRIMDTVKIGMVQGSPIPDIVSRVVAQTNRTVTEAETITRTAVNFYSNKAKELVYRANADIFDEEAFVSTLDSRTTPICRGLDGKRFPVGEGPRPPMHMRCRSLRVAVIGDELIGDRPAKPATEKMLLREYASKKGFKAPRTRDGLPHGTKGDYDAFARGRIRELTGTVPASTTYDQWLRSQSASFQDDVLGKGKAKLFRDGLTLDKFVDDTGREFTLAQLTAKNTESLFLKQPGISQKAKSLLQSGLTPAQVAVQLVDEFPDADTPSVANITQWQTELKNAGYLDQLKALPLSKADKSASAILDIAATVEAALPQGLSSHIAGQWLSVANDLDGLPGAYAHYKAGYGVIASADKLGSIPKVQAQQVLAHELGHMLHKAHDLNLSDDMVAAMKSSINPLGPQAKLLYAYYFADIDELMAEIYAQAISPSPITSQGLPSAVFNSTFKVQIDQAKSLMASKWKVIEQPKPNGAPTFPGATPGVFNNASSLTKALILQGIDNESIITQVKSAFPDFKITTSRIASFRAKLKKQGLYPATGGPIVEPAKGVVQPSPEPIIKPQPGVLPTGADQEALVKKLAVELGTSDPDTIFTIIKKQYPDLDVSELMGPTKMKLLAKDALLPAPPIKPSLGTNTPTEHSNPTALLHPALTSKMEQYSAANKSFAAVLAEAKAMGITMGQKKQAAFKQLFEDMKSGQIKKQSVPNNVPPPTPAPPAPPVGNLPQGMTQLQAEFATKIGVKPHHLHHANNLAKSGKSAEQIYNELSVSSIGLDYAESKLKEMANAAVGKFNPSDKGKFGSDGKYIPPPPKPKTPQELIRDLKPNRPATNPNDGLPPPPRFTDEDKITAVRAWAGEHYADRAEQKGLKGHEYGALRAYTGSHYREWNQMLRQGRYATDFGLQALVEAANEGLSKLPNFVGTVRRGLTTHDLDRYFTVYREGSIVEEHAFVSTAQGSSGFHGNMEVIIQSKTGKSVKFLSQHPSENEVLFGPGTKFKVTRVERTSGGGRIHMEQVL
jgi:SPP1 gp7 family putative phage head morphogenesis protein